MWLVRLKKNQESSLRGHLRACSRRRQSTEIEIKFDEDGDLTRGHKFVFLF